MPSNDEPFGHGVHLDFAYLVSCRQYGADRPTANKIKSLDSRSPSDNGSVQDRYDRMHPWFIKNFMRLSSNKILVVSEL